MIITKEQYPDITIRKAKIIVVTTTITTRKLDWTVTSTGHQVLINGSNMVESSRARHGFGQRVSRNLVVRVGEAIRGNSSAPSRFIERSGIDTDKVADKAIELYQIHRSDLMKRQDKISHYKKMDELCKALNQKYNRDRDGEDSIEFLTSYSHDRIIVNLPKGFTFAQVESVASSIEHELIYLRNKC